MTGLERSEENGRLAEALHELTAVLLNTISTEQALRQIADIASRCMPTHPMVGFTLGQDGGRLTAASSDSRVESLDRMQAESGDGPCREAMRTGRVVCSNDLAAEHRWGELPNRFLERDILSVCSHPLAAGEQVLGALNLYSEQRDGFTDAVQAAAELTAQHTAILLQATLRASEQAELVAQLRHALASRAVIDQAIGILMARRRCDAGQVMAWLRAASQRSNRKLHDLATEIVRSATGHDPRPPAFDEPI
ncbi:GAF and ANTAR domain-containing protein [Nonomuraea sp. NPDC050310]|uniref:GAF and ANTAR domain-containing protein n=1 Tax=unclassified Nonomuraea TaxID=2593643 RepID=UPI0033DBF635